MAPSFPFDPPHPTRIVPPTQVPAVARGDVPPYRRNGASGFRMSKTTPPPPSPPAEEQLLNISELKEKSISDLTKMAKGLDIDGITGLRKQELIFKILQQQTEKA